MKERPILFSTPMVRAILDGRKTMTRRVVKLPKWATGREIEIDDYGLPVVFCPDAETHAWINCPHATFHAFDRDGMLKPRFDGRLWVRETWAVIEDEFDCKRIDGMVLSHAVCYAATETAEWRSEPDAEERRADGMSATYIHPKRWRPSIHMPRWASRITLEVTGVRGERVQDISDEDAIREGVTLTKCSSQLPGDAIADFAKLWDKINAKRGYSWESNPWVWVIEFRNTANDQR